MKRLKGQKQRYSKRLAEVKIHDFFKTQQTGPFLVLERLMASRHKKEHFTLMDAGSGWLKFRINIWHKGYKLAYCEVVEKQRRTQYIVFVNMKILVIPPITHHNVMFKSCKTMCQPATYRDHFVHFMFQSINLIQFQCPYKINTNEGETFYHSVALLISEIWCLVE